MTAVTAPPASPAPGARPDPAPLLRWPARGEIWIVALYALTAAFVTWQQLHLDHINNWRMARWSFYQLLQGGDLYGPQPASFFDLYQYSPTFALLVAPFALPPLWLGLLLFNTFNIGVFYYAVRRFLPGRLGLAALLILYFEVLRSTQNTEINTLVTGLILLAFLWLEGAASAGGGGHRRRRGHQDLPPRRGGARPPAPLALALRRGPRGRAGGRDPRAAPRDPRVHPAAAVPLVGRARGPLQRRAPHRLADGAAEPRDPGRLAQLAGAARGHPAPPAPLSGAARRLGRRGVPAGDALPAPPVRHPLQPPGRVADLHHRHDGRRPVVPHGCRGGGTITRSWRSPGRWCHYSRRSCRRAC